MTVRELREKLFEVEDQDGESELIAALEQIAQDRPDHGPGYCARRAIAQDTLDQLQVRP